MTTYSLGKSKSNGTITAGTEKGNYIFKSKDQTVHLERPKSKITLDSMNVLVEIEVDGTLDWVCLSVANISEQFEGFDPLFGGVDEATRKIYGHDTKNKRLVAAIFEDRGTFVLGSRDGVQTYADEDVTMAVIQRNSPGTSSFDVVWCFHKTSTVVESVFNKKDLHDVIKFCGDVTDNVFDNGPDPYDWKHFIKVQKNQKGEVEDWVGVFAPLTDDDDDDDDDDDYAEGGEESDEDLLEEEEEEEEINDTDTDESECSWSSASDSEDDRPTKRAKH